MIRCSAWRKSSATFVRKWSCSCGFAIINCCMRSDAIESGGADRLGRVDISTVVRTTQNIARHPKCQNLTAAIFGTSTYPADTFINEVEEPGSFSLGENRTSATPIDEGRCVVEEPFLFLSRKQISNRLRLDIRSGNGPRTNLQDRPARTIAWGRCGTPLVFGELQNRAYLGCAEIDRLPLPQCRNRHPVRITGADLPSSERRLQPPLASRAADLSLHSALGSKCIQLCQHTGFAINFLC